jgi:hypothetical protein
MSLTLVIISSLEMWLSIILHILETSRLGSPNRRLIETDVEQTVIDNFDLAAAVAQ